jgi:subtilisin family serine protease
MFDLALSAAVRHSRRLAFAGLASLALLSEPASIRPAAAAEPVRVLVGFKQPSFALSSPARASILSRSRERTRIASLRGQVRHQFRRTDAMVAELQPEAVAALRNDPSVAYVEEDRLVHLYQQLDPTTPSAFQLVPELVPWGISGDDESGGVRAIEAGADGEGVRVGVLDTGIGPHPDLTVAGGHNFVANTTDFSDDVGHGTHVAGTIAAARNQTGVVGVAPKVELYGLKVLNSRGSGRTSQVVAGIEWAIEHELQVINMSFGSSRGSLTEQRAIEAAARAGIVMVAASGNESSRVGFPAAYPQVMAVGAVNKARQLARFSNQGPEMGFVAPGVGILSTVPEALGFSLAAATNEDGSAELEAMGIRFSAPTPAEGITGPIRFAGLGTPEEVAAADLEGAIALIERGDLTFTEKVANAAAAGAVGVLIFNNLPGNYSGTLAGAGAIPALSLSREEGLVLREADSASIRLIVAPRAPYTRFSGTSMACPHIAGVAALVLSARPDLDPDGLRMILRQTATDLGPTGRDEGYGDGLVNAAAAVQAARGLPATP